MKKYWKHIITAALLFGCICWLAADQKDTMATDTLQTIQKAKCPNCGSTEIFDEGNDQYFITCYGHRAYWEKDYYPPRMLIPVNICAKCGTIYLPIGD